MEDENKMMGVIVEVDIERFIRHPAADSMATYAGQYVYFIKDKMIIGRGKINGGNNFNVDVIPDDDASKTFFGDDMILRDLKFGFRYSKYTGSPEPIFTDEDPDRHKGTEILGACLIEHDMVPKWFGPIKNLADFHYKKQPGYVEWKPDNV